MKMSDNIQIKQEKREPDGNVECGNVNTNIQIKKEHKSDEENDNNDRLVKPSTSVDNSNPEQFHKSQKVKEELVTNLKDLWIEVPSLKVKDNLSSKMEPENHSNSEFQMDSFGAISQEVNINNKNDTKSVDKFSPLVLILHCEKVLGDKESPLVINLTTPAQDNVPNNKSKKPYTCEECKKQFRRYVELKRHTSVPISEKPYSCKVCNKEYHCSSNFKVHMLTHTRKKLYTCDICNKQVASSSNLKRHQMLTHTGEKPHTCDICKKQFGEKSHLRTHMKMIHMREKPYSCDVCKKQFCQIGDLKRHKLTHTGKKWYNCELCN